MKDYQNALQYHQYLASTTNPDITGHLLMIVKSLVGVCKALNLPALN
jgi:hypothetical protein